MGTDDDMLKQMGVIPLNHPDPELVALQERWSPQWKIWRARRDHDARPTGSFMATRIDPEAGPWPTVMEKTSADLDAALEWQRTPEAFASAEPPSYPHATT